MQVEWLVRDEGLQTSPREESSEEKNIAAADIIPHVVSDIIRDLPINILTETKETSTGPTKTIEQITQTSPCVSDTSTKVDSPEVEPYEIHIETSFVVPEDKKISGGQSTPVVLEIQKTYVIDETQPGLVREIQSNTQEKVKKSRSKKKKNEKQSVSMQRAKDSYQSSTVDENFMESKSSKYATLQITKTTVYDTSLHLSGQVQPSNHSSVKIEEIISDENSDEHSTPGKNEFGSFIILLIHSDKSYNCSIFST